MLEELHTITEGMRRRFPRGNDPFQMMTRLLEECGELAQMVNHFEDTGVKQEKYGEPDPGKLAKEVMDVLGGALQVALHYGVVEDVEALLADRYQRLTQEGFIQEESVPFRARFVHTNLVAVNWKRLAQFYEQIFGCIPVPPERNLSGSWIDDAVNVPDVCIRGIHLRLPGYGDAGPTLEIFQYNPELPHPMPAANRPGFGHIAFAVDDVEAAREVVLTAGGSDVGKVIRREIPGAGSITFVYLTDPEGNILELQRWDG
jgi:predicted enzyme related to lactoylglutathione lyase/NTP pyrophosphatase (non-canonical NTP hydrolase)